MRINYNVSSIIARNALNNNDMRLSNSTQRLSSGYKINSAADDAAGLAIARKMNAQIKSLQQANKNSNDGLSVVNTADGAMAEMHDILQRMNELAVQSANGTNSDSDREQIQKEIDELVEEMDRIADTTQFNAQNLLDGSFAYKGFTNTENVKVMSYSEGVASGTYAIGMLTYHHYEDTITYANQEKEVKHKERFEASSPDDVQKMLVTSTSVSQYAAIDGIKAFPEGSKVILEDENIVIKAENDFEIKITMNSREPINTGITTTTVASNITVNNYRNIIVENTATNERYNISELNIYEEEDENGNITSKCYTSIEDDNGRDLRDDFAGLFEKQYPDCDIEITNLSYSNGQFTVEFVPTDLKTNTTLQPETLTFELYQEKNEYGNVVDTKTLDDYWYSTTETRKTTYTLGQNSADDCIALNMTGMGAMKIQVGANEGQQIEIEIPALNTVNLGIDDLDVSTEDSATEAIDIIGNAINQLSGVRAKIGAISNRIEHTITNLNTTEENMTASYSRIMDVDMATEMTEYSTVQVLVQASTSMLAQANERPQQVLQLLQ
ncbi:MAG: hypothetical protein J6D08_08475 [Lachnospiraceae bacterium]|nr:hypothetical protein [Lachnospiraceae bacterium]